MEKPGKPVVIAWIIFLVVCVNIGTGMLTKPKKKLGQGG
jgi:hypothetical protein